MMTGLHRDVIQTSYFRILNNFVQIIIVINAIFFVVYGLQCFISKFMYSEFKRFGLSNSQRILTGILQLMGSAGLLYGLINPILGFMASLGLTLMMLVAFAVRIKIRDSLIQTAPSFLFLILNAWISWSIYSTI
jgi:hypothetical protein